MHARSYDTSSLFKIFLTQSNTLKYLSTSYVTEYSSYSVSFFAYFCLFITHYILSSSVAHPLTMMPFYSDSLSSVEHSSTMMTFFLPLSAEQLCEKVLSTRNSFNSLSTVEQTCEVGICFVALISVLMNRYLCHNALSALMHNNYNIVEILKFNGNDMNKALHANKNICMDMENIGHKNETGIFRKSTKAFIDGKKKKSTIWCYYATKLDTKANKPKDNMAS